MELEPFLLSLAHSFQKSMPFNFLVHPLTDKSHVLCVYRNKTGGGFYISYLEPKIVLPIG